MRTTDNIDASTSDILSDDLTANPFSEFNSDLEFANLDDVVYNSSSSFDISEISDLLLDNIDEFIFITDTVSKNIVYLNKPLQDALDIDGEFVGACFKLIHGRDEPCENCNAHKNISSTFNITTQLSEKLDRLFVIKSKTIELYGRTYTINIAVLKNDKISKLETENKLSVNDIIAPYVSIYTNNIKNPDVQIYRILECIGIECSADFCTLYEHYDLENKDDGSFSDRESEQTNEISLARTHIWISEGSLDLKNSFDVPSEVLNYAVLDQKENRYQDNTGYYYSIPVVFDEKYLGTIFIKNPNKKQIEILLPALYTITNLFSLAVSQLRTYAQLSNISNRDSLTGLKNRVCLLKDLNALSLNSDIGVIYLNVNGLKKINKDLGIKEGDTILVKTGSLLKQLLHDSDYIYRIGGDEFIGIQPAIMEHDFMMLSDMLKAFMTNEKGFSVSAGCQWTRSGMSIMSALNKAESDMYEEKKNFYRTHSDKNATERYRQENDKLLNIIEPSKINELIAQGCFKVLYQPKFKIQGARAEIAGAEALVRLIINGSVVPPDDFIPALESAHYTHLIDYYVFETVCKRMADRKANGQSILPVSCNFSRHTIVRPEFKNKLTEIMNKYGIDHNMIPLEVSEHTNTTRHQELVAVTDKLADEGFNISIDDFGTAHANIYTLADLSVSEVKFDKKLIDNLACEDNEKLKTILSVLITMCKKLGIKTIAEGVEDKEQNDILRSLGCDEIQGYFYSKPVKDEDYYDKF